MRGSLTPCCRSAYSYGNWQEQGLKETWVSARAQAFRQDILEGRFPNSDCATCYKKGTAVSLTSALRLPLRTFLAQLMDHSRQGIWQIQQLETLFGKRDFDAEAEMAIANIRRVLADHARTATQPESSAEYQKLVRKLNVIVNVAESFLRGHLMPAEVAPVRQANIVAICNARCIQCPFLTTGEIIHGVPMPDGSRKKQMTTKDKDGAFSCMSSAVDFVLNGSEFFLIKDWENLAIKLNNEGIKFRISTNGMLLSEKNVRTVARHRYAGKINISLDGSRPSTIEKIRARVKFDVVKANLQFYFRHLEECDYRLNTSFSYCLMNENVDELPEFIDTIRGFSNGNFNFIKPTVHVQILEMRGTQEYIEFAQRQHPSTIEPSRIRDAFLRFQAIAEKYGIGVIVFYRYPIGEFINLGCPVPTPEPVVISPGVGLLDAAEA